MHDLTDLIGCLKFARDEIAPDITVQRLLVLLHVARDEGLSQSELASRLGGISTTALSRNLADLSERTSRRTDGPGLIRQEVDANNLRRKRIFLTTAGRQLIRRWRRTLPESA